MNERQQRARAFAGHARAAADRVVTWKWSKTTGALDPRPLAFERDGSGPPRLSPREPEGPETVAYGLDASGRGLLERRYRHGEVDAEQVLASQDDAAVEWWLAFWIGPGDAVVRRVIRCEMRADGLPRTATLETETYLDREQYDYDEEGRIRRVVVDPSPGDDRSQEQYVCSYAGGSLDLVTEMTRGEIVYERRKRPLKDELALVEEELTRAATHAVETVGRNDPVWAVILAYEDLLPPVIGVATESERQAWLRNGADDVTALWNPAHLKHALGITDELHPRNADAFERACTRLERRWQDTDDDDQPEALCARIAQRINSHVWRAGVVTQDFVAVAVDVTLDELSEQVRRTAPSGAVQQLRASGFL